SGERTSKLRTAFLELGPSLIVLDNHENDAACAELMNAFADTDVCFVITARRLLLSGVLVYPVTPPLVTAGLDAFPRVAGLTRLLRWSPLALDIADGMVGSGATTAAELGDYLRNAGVERVSAIEHEDDLPEVKLLVDWLWPRLPSAAHRILAVLAHLQGDSAARDSLRVLAKGGRSFDAELEALIRLRLVQEPVHQRYALHAVVRYALQRRTQFSADAWFEYYVSLLERNPDRLAQEQTHWFAAMDHAYVASDFERMLRVEALSRKLEGRE
ncbi:MAG TPA: hypothetical protein VFQ61_07410, partial [Polyangiaceae bacterium]|nr:hypothetical protein [Polyangiaceae bacterium]